MTDIPNTNFSTDVEIVLNSKIADSSSKIIFENNILCSQFLRDYIDIPYLKNVQPEDIEDVSEQYVPLFSEERNADRVKKVHIKNENPFFLVSLIEHKSSLDYNVCMQIFRYMVYIWETYAKEAERLQKGITKLSTFKYPPILPIVYYEGIGNWSVPFDFKSRIIEGDTFGKYVPNFEYYLVPLRQYTNEELLAKKDEISLVMMINRMQTSEDIEIFRNLPSDTVENILKDTPEHLLTIISDILRAFLLKMKVPTSQTEELVGKVKEKKMGYLFENVVPYDIEGEKQKYREKRILAEQQIEQAEQQIEQANQQIKQANQQIKQAEELLQFAQEQQKLAEEQQKQAQEQQKQAQEQQKQAQEQQKRAEKAEQQLEKSLQTIIKTCQELSVSKENTFFKIQETFELTTEDVWNKIHLYWKD